MLAKAVVALPVLAALAERAQAINHRHLHKGDKRDVLVEMKTVFQTVYVMAGEEAPPATNFVVAEKPVVTSTVAITTSHTSHSKHSKVPSTTTPPIPSTTMTTAVKQPSNAAHAEALPVISIPDILPPPAHTTTSKPPAAATTTHSSSGSGGSPCGSKRGMAYNDALLANLFGETCSSCCWGYNWGSAKNGLGSKYSYVPQLWSTKPQFTNNWESDVEEALSSGSKAIFSFNEPDMGSQANMSPAAAASAHAQYLNKYAGKALIGAPAVSNSGQAGQGLDWLKSFIQACKSQSGGCQIDFCNVHWYSEAEYADTLYDHISQAHEICEGKPIWLTEFAPIGASDDKSAFLKEVIPKLEAIDYLHAYSYFMVSTESLLSSVTDLSIFGKVYAALT